MGNAPSSSPPPTAPVSPAGPDQDPPPEACVPCREAPAQEAARRAARRAEDEHTDDDEGEEEDWVDPQTDQQGCGRLYEVLEECLGENDRDWRRCGRELGAFRRCYDAHRAAHGKPTTTDAAAS